MKKIKKFLLGNVKTVVAFILGIIISGGTVYAATILFDSDEVSYSNTTSGLAATDVQAAIDELANAQGIDSNSINFATLQTNTAKTVLASSKGVCINRNNKLNCFKINNWEEEQNHIQQVFSDGDCDVHSSYVNCGASDFYCSVNSNGRVNCSANSDDSYCIVLSDGSMGCN